MTLRYVKHQGHGNHTLRQKRKHWLREFQKVWHLFQPCHTVIQGKPFHYKAYLSVNRQLCDQNLFFSLFFEAMSMQSGYPQTLHVDEALNSQRSSFLCLKSAEIKGIHYHTCQDQFLMQGYAVVFEYAVTTQQTRKGSPNLNLEF